MADITVNIIDGVTNIAQAGFGIPAIFGETQQFKVLKAGTGKSQLVFVSATRGGDASIEIISGSTLQFTNSSGDTVTLELPAGGATAKEVFDEFNDNAPTDVTNLVDLQLANSGSGEVATLTLTALDDISEFDIRSKAQVSSLLLPYYATTDSEYEKALALFNQDLSPEKVYVFNAYAASPPAIATQIITYDNQDFYFLLLTDTTKARAIEASNWAEANEKVMALVNSDATLLEDLELATNAFVFLQDASRVGEEHPEAAITGLQAPKTPGSSTWKFHRVNGVTAETDLTLINSARDNNGNIFILKSGLTYSVEGKMTNGLFIDQKRSRDYIKARIAEAFLALFIQEDKIPYDNSGIAQLENTLADQLNSFGDQGIIAIANDANEVEQSYNNIYQFSITAPTRAQVLADSSLGSIPDRTYSIAFEYVEKGAIHELDATGTVVTGLVSLGL